MTLDDIYQRTVADGECRVWRGALNSSSNVPVVALKGKAVNVRRIVLEIQGVDIEGKLAVATCQTEGCVCAEHMAAWTRRKLSKEAAKRTKYGKSVARESSPFPRPCAPSPAWTRGRFGRFGTAAYRLARSPRNTASASTARGKSCRTGRGRNSQVTRSPDLECETVEDVQFYFFDILA